MKRKTYKAEKEHFYRKKRRNFSEFQKKEKKREKETEEQKSLET